MEKPPHRIIAIDDNSTDLLLLRQAFDELKKPYTLEIVSNGEEAARYLADVGRSGPDPCLIILDLHLPKLDGLSILRAIKMNPNLSYISVAVITSMASPSERAQVLEFGVDLFRTKGFDWEETLVLAGELLQLCDRNRPLAAKV